MSRSHVQKYDFFNHFAPLPIVTDVWRRPCTLVTHANNFATILSTDSPKIQSSVIQRLEFRQRDEINGSLYVLRTGRNS